MEHEGVSTHRLSSNPREKAFHDAWLEEHANDEDGCLLSAMLSNGTTPAKVSDRDATVAATVIQWLGSPVGNAFLKNVLADIGLAEKLAEEAERARRAEERKPARPRLGMW